MSSSIMTSTTPEGATLADLSSLAALLLITQQRGTRLHLGLRTPDGFPAARRNTLVVGLVTSEKRCLYAERQPLARRGRLLCNLEKWLDITPTQTDVTIERGVIVDEAVQDAEGWMVTLEGETYLVKERHAISGKRVVETVEVQHLVLNAELTTTQLEDIAALLWESSSRNIDRTLDYDDEAKTLEVPAIPSEPVTAGEDGRVLLPRRFKPFFGGDMPEDDMVTHEHALIRVVPPC